MEIEKIKSIIEGILFASGRQVNIKELMISLELPKDDLENIIVSMQEEYKNQNRGIEIIKVDESYQLCTKKELYEYIYPILDKRSKPNLSNAALETLSIIAYNSKITRAEIEAIRGVNVDACIYKLLEYGLIQEAGKADLPGKPMTYITTNEFLKMFGYTSLDDLPELPRYKLDENQQIVIDDLIESENIEEKETEEIKNKEIEAPEPEREESNENKDEEK
ncbi:MAG: SMC-Scp complex subunit ScpB [Clostridia bacterium]|jgi:segregation and condensation protein B|nr:SMC-Scp complex subunit ScpB [Clostridia bacterium]